jgi:hypothetical protein
MEGQTVLEWFVQYRPNAPKTERPPFMFESTQPWTEENALKEQERLRLASEPGYPKVFRRKRIVYPDLIFEMEEV